MAGLRVTLLAEKRRRTRQQEVAVGTVGQMTIGAAFDHWGVFPEEGPALVRMTTRAQFEV